MKAILPEMTRTTTVLGFVLVAFLAGSLGYLAGGGGRVGAPPAPPGFGGAPPSFAEIVARVNPAVVHVDVIEDARGITLYADLPGVPKDKLELHIDADTITIEATLSLDVPQGLEVSHAEVSIPRFRRAFTLSKELDASKVTAELGNGVLKLRIPKAEHAQPRRIQVKVT